MRKPLPGIRHLLDDVASARVTDSLVPGIVGDEFGVTGIGAMERAPDRSQCRIAEAVVGHVVAECDIDESPLRPVDLLCLGVEPERESLNQKLIASSG